jgi:hypothetical protein
MEKEVLKETHRSAKPSVTPKVESKKRNYKPRKKKETKQEEFAGLETEMIQRSGEVHSIVKPIQAGSYKVGKSFHIFFEKKPNSLHRFFAKLLLGWKWHDQK